RRDCHATRLKLWKERFELVVRDHFYFVHDWNQRLIAHAFVTELQRRHHPVYEPDRHAIRERMICCFLRCGPVLVWIARNICSARDDFDFDFFHVVRFDFVVFHRLHHGSERRVAERFDGETFHPAIQNAVVRLRRGRQILDQPFAIEACRLTFVLHVTEHGEQTFLAIDDVLRPGKSFTRKQRALGAHAPRPRIDSVFHVGQLPCCNSAWTKRARRADANRRDHLLWSEVQNAARRHRRGKRAQGGVVPPIFAHTWPSDFTQTHFNFVGNDRGENQ